MEIPAEVERLVQERRTAMAVKRLCELTGASISEGRRVVKSLESRASRGRPGRRTRHLRVTSTPRYGWLAVLGILIGGLMTGRSAYEVYMSFRTAGWQRTEGVILQSETRRARSSEGHTTELILRFEYDVGAKQYTGNRVGYARVYSGRSATRAASTYRVGRRVDIYYDPDDPAAAVLEPGGSFAIYPVFALGIFFLILGLWAIRKMKERSSADRTRMQQHTA